MFAELMPEQAFPPSHRPGWIGHCLGNTLRTRAGDHTSPKRKRGSGLTSLTLRASMRGVSPGVEPGPAIRGPFRCKHRKELRKRGPDRHDPRLGARVPGRDLDGDRIAGKLVKGEPAHDLDPGSLVLVSRDCALRNHVTASALVVA